MLTKTMRTSGQCVIPASDLSWVQSGTLLNGARGLQTSRTLVSRRSMLNDAMSVTRNVPHIAPGEHWMRMIGARCQ